MAKHKHEEHENHERWLVSYADFITLLFAFFVVMYSISSVNEGKYRTVSESIKAALNPVVSPPSSPTPISLSTNKASLTASDAPGSKEVVIRKLRNLVKSIKAVPKMSMVWITEKVNGDIVITIPDQLLFNSGEAAVRTEALPFLEGLSGALVELNRHTKVEGHTDNVPIRTAQFPSNWELSAGRAVMVVRVLSELYGVPSDHLAAVGHADTRPVTENLDPEQRAKNRRVEVVILEQAPPAPTLETGSNVDELGRSTEDEPQSASQLEPELSGIDRPKTP
ncbi:MAG: OmpA family protein [Nitrospira sp.]|nr:OmpA family protein [Nitrospira sp.]MDH4370533.1 OmpA family protein [Nitrospira sp.]MDH5347221.1 OmpA family protein [Nitrospira sp.]MDH5498590.1 OmpA family protein [Nitrospira sp.]MDH5724528.1 OmpA family protein [Nitrospira sp.]